MQVTGAAASSSAQQGPIAPQPRLARAAHEFEAQMMKELLKPMTDSDGLGGDADESGSGSNGAQGEFATEALGRALSEQGGLGIATSIVHSLSHAGNSPHAAQVTGNPHANTLISKAE